MMAIKDKYLPELLERFWDQTTEADNGCIEWTGPRDENGYGHMQVRPAGRAIGVHRISLEIAMGLDFPSFIYACHHCDNPPCVNAEHVFAGTGSDNKSDAGLKKRGCKERYVPKDLPKRLNFVGLMLRRRGIKTLKQFDKRHILNDMEILNKHVPDFFISFSGFWLAAEYILARQDFCAATSARKIG